MVGARSTLEMLVDDSIDGRPGPGQATVTGCGVDQSVSVDLRHQVMDGTSKLRAMPQADGETRCSSTPAKEAGMGGRHAVHPGDMIRMLYTAESGGRGDLRGRRRGHARYSATSDMPDVLNASVSGTMVTVTAMSAGNHHHRSREHGGDRGRRVSRQTDPSEASIDLPGDGGPRGVSASCCPGPRART